MDTIIDVGYTTGSGNIMPLRVCGHTIRRGDVPIVERDDVKGLCDWNGGCKGHNGGCPPYAPYFENLKPKMDLLYVLTVEFDMAYAIEYSGWWKGASVPGLFIITYADRLTMNYMQRLLKVFEEKDLYCLGLSNCPGCRPADCKVIRGEPCAKPKKRRFSVEAVGILCNELHQDIFGEFLPWWYRTQEYMPTKVVRYSAVFVDEWWSHTAEGVLMHATHTDKSYVRVENVPVVEYDVKTLTVPGGCLDEGTEYQAYRIPLERMDK